MADGVEFNITGIDSLLGKLEAVSRDLRYKGGALCPSQGSKTDRSRSEEKCVANRQSRNGQSDRQEHFRSLESPTI